MLFVLTSLFARSQEYRIEEIYKKYDVDYGTLDQDGNEVEYLLVPVSLDNGEYRVEISDDSGDLYEIKGTDYYIEIGGYFGYAGYGTDCLIKISGYSQYIYKLE